MDDGWPRSRAYTGGTVAAWCIFLLTIWLLSWASAAGGWPREVLWGIAVALTASVAIQFVAAYRLIARQDEYVRAITGKRMILAAGLTITVAVLCGIAEQFLAAPDLPMWLVYPLFWGTFGLVSQFVRTSLP